ncbi:MAG: T9SS type A sorting domain-containing protein [Bacteroidales bacterium]|nr:T9SS type A sorting domain-containing protein [Bacteroidales bacterium]
MKHILILILLGLLTAPAAKAQSELVVQLADGSTTVYALSQQPVVAFEGDNLVITAGNANATFARAEVTQFFFRPVGTGIGKVSSGDLERRVRFAAPDLIVVSGIAEDDALRVVTVEGRTAAATIDRTAGIANISLAGLPTGVYILKINQTDTIKIFKK